MQLKQDLLCKMRIHPLKPWLMATGGDERDVCIWDLKTLDQPYWQAKNVKNDKLDLRVPVWITELQWVNNDQEQLWTGTGYHHIRHYDTKQRRPTVSFTLGEHPIKAMALDQEYPKLI